ncbi:HNH endonuclease [Bosea sp. (in: a-proteobacteria)]|jgi:hypothetical protein|uniref:HNH endonuclease n=1 Tax=Bosea sp. (in: a-proteobacteria) TaxID=1871050 RepID=UPI0039C8BA55
MAAWPYSTSTWQRLRQAKLSARPICEACERRGRTVLADAVDHIVAINKGGDAFPPLAGLMSLCTSCHNSKTGRVDKAHSKAQSRFKGCDVNGDPIDPEDGWWAAPAPPSPAAFRSRPIEASGPMGESNADLVFANDLQQGDERWV